MLSLARETCLEAVVKLGCLRVTKALGRKHLSQVFVERNLEPPRFRSILVRSPFPSHSPDSVGLLGMSLTVGAFPSPADSLQKIDPRHP
jgi:hypothetical protein